MPPAPAPRPRAILHTLAHVPRPPFPAPCAARIHPPPGAVGDKADRDALAPVGGRQELEAWLAHRALPVAGAHGAVLHAMAKGGMQHLWSARVLEAGVHNSTAWPAQGWHEALPPRVHKASEQRSRSAVAAVAPSCCGAALTVSGQIRRQPPRPSSSKPACSEANGRGSGGVSAPCTRGIHACTADTKL